jgi:para-aminobenzoate synthetase component 1
MLNWASRFNIFCLLDSNSYRAADSSFDLCLAAGVKNTYPDNIASLDDVISSRSKWLFGHLGFEYFEQDDLVPVNPFVDFKNSFFFEPAFVITLKDDQLTIYADEHTAQVYDELLRSPENIEGEKQALTFTYAMSKDEYLERLAGIESHIHRGDCYELNFCQHFYATDTRIDPYQAYLDLTRISPNPYAALYRLNDKYCVCASPERFLKKQGDKLISEPIKGTSGRSPSPEEDEKLKQALQHSEKDRSENVMIVDLVRNDLSMVCTEGSVAVPSLSEVRSFPRVHHLVSTVTGNVSNETSFSAIMQACFPMGSMTGAPKKKVLELIREFEREPRGLFSGTIGYINPDGDFDFNVVIRSLMYDETKKVISCKTGGGITAGSSAEDEYNESLLKAEAIMKIFSADQ